MGRKRMYSTSAERLRAFRLRQKTEQAVEAPPKSEVQDKVRVLSRPARLSLIIGQIQNLLNEYQGWRSNLPEPFQEGDLAEKLDETIEQLTEVVDLLNDIDLPKGFGRD